MKIIFFLGVVLGIGSLAVRKAHAEPPAPLSAIQVREAWERLMPAKLPSAGYFRLVNVSDRDETLIGVTSGDYADVELHETMEEGQGTHMRPVRQLIIPAKGEVLLKPGSFHLMLIDPTRAIRAGETVAIELHFADGGKVVAQLPVKPASAQK
jgi:copper(I)-binding protein